MKIPKRLIKKLVLKGFKLHRNLFGTKTMYHVTPTRNIENISKRGLKLNKIGKLYFADKMGAVNMAKRRQLGKASAYKAEPYSLFKARVLKKGFKYKSPLASATGMADIYDRAVRRKNIQFVRHLKNREL